MDVHACIMEVRVLRLGVKGLTEPLGCYNESLQQGGSWISFALMVHGGMAVPPPPPCVHGKCVELNGKLKNGPKPRNMSSPPQDPSAHAAGVGGSIRRGARAVRARCMRGAGTGVVP